MSIEQRFARNYWDRLTDQIGAKLDWITVRLDHEREWMRLCLLRKDESGADDCMDAIADLEADWRELMKQMPEMYR